LDNSGLKIAKQLKIQKTKKPFPAPGDLLTVSKKKFRRRKKLSAKLFTAIVVMTRRPIRRIGGMMLRCYNNRIVICDGRGILIGSHLFGPVCHEVRFKHTSYIHKRLYARIACRFM